MSAFLDVVTGYLGAGKTTFILKYIDYLKENNITFAVIENEFGRAGTDADILRASCAEILEISGGCVCCTLKTTLYDMLNSLSEKVDRIILEPSGIFCGDDLIDIINSPSLSIKPGFWLGVIDPLMMNRLAPEELEVLTAEIIHAGAVYISKTDLVGSVTERAVKSVTEYLNGAIEEILPMMFSGFDIDFEALLETGYVVRPHERKVFDHTTMYMSASITPKRKFTENELLEALNAVYSDDCGEIIRIKGSVAAENGGWRVNCSIGCDSILYDPKITLPILNIIGKKLNRKKINTIFE